MLPKLTKVQEDDLDWSMFSKLGTLFMDYKIAAGDAYCLDDAPKVSSKKRLAAWKKAGRMEDRFVKSIRALEKKAGVKSC